MSLLLTILMVTLLLTVDAESMDFLWYAIFAFLLQGVVFFLNAFLVFAFADSVCLWANLYDRAPTADSYRFNQNDSRLLLTKGASHIIGNESSVMYNFHDNSMTRAYDNRGSLLSRQEVSLISSEFTNGL